MFLLFFGMLDVEQIGLELSSDTTFLSGQDKPRTGYILNHAPVPYSQKWLIDMMLDETPFFII